MVNTLKVEQKTDNISIPNYLVYEVIDGMPIYYKGYKAVVQQLKKLEDIMGSSGLQSYIISVIVEHLLFNIDRKRYKILYSELGLHLEFKNNLSADIAVYEKNQLKRKLTKKYIHFAPKIAIEVDTKVEFDQLSSGDYINIKTQKLLDFGVDKVVWIFTESQKVLVATNEKDWLIKPWGKDIEILGCIFSIATLLKEEDIL